MSQPERDLLLGEVRDLSQRFKAGGSAAFDAFSQLVSRLLSLTIAAPYPGLALFAGASETRVLSGRRGIGDPIPFAERGYLRLIMTLSLVPGEGRTFLKVMDSSYQYQLDERGDRWVFRYDYRRLPADPYPAAHLQVRGRLEDDCLPPGRPLSRLHFPSGRVSLEGVIRLLADQFQIPCARRQELWWPVLAESERLFYEIAHSPLSGPTQ